MSVEGYHIGRTFLTSQRREFQACQAEPARWHGQDVFRILPDSSVYKEIIQKWNEMFEYGNMTKHSRRSDQARFHPPQCTSMTRRYWNAMQQSLHTHNDTWYVSWKSNGERCAVFITTLQYSSERVCVLLNRKMEMYRVDMAWPLNYYEGTVLTGELFEEKEHGMDDMNDMTDVDGMKDVPGMHDVNDEDRITPTQEIIQLRIEMDDIQALGGALMGNREKKARIEKVYAVAHQMAKLAQPSKGSLVFTLTAKPWVSVVHLKSFIDTLHLHYLLKDCALDNSLSYEPSSSLDSARIFWRGVTLPDGLIFQKNNAPLGKGTVDTILKWKPFLARTRDWLSMVDMNQTIVSNYSYVGSDIPSSIQDTENCMYYQDTWWRRMITQDINETFEHFVRRAPVHDALDMHVLPSKTQLHGQIHEWALDPMTSCWKPIHVRHDKQVANHDTVLQEEHEDFQIGVVLLEELLATLSPQATQIWKDNPDIFRSILNCMPLCNILEENIGPSAAGGHSNLSAPPMADLKHLLPHHIHLDFSQDTFPTLTKYEKANLIGTEAERLNQGGDAYVNILDSSSILEIAERAVLAGCAPAIIQRPLPNGFTQSFHACQMDTQWSNTNIV